MPDPTNRNQDDGHARPSTDENICFDEESRPPLTDRDRDRLLDMLDNPPEPNDALRNAANRTG